MFGSLWNRKHCCSLFLVWIFPLCLSDLPIHRPKPLYIQVMRNSESTYCTRDQYLAPRVAFITWLVNFFLEKKYVNSATSSSKNGGEVLPKIIQVGWSLKTKNQMDSPHLRCLTVYWITWTDIFWGSNLTKMNFFFSSVNLFGTFIIGLIQPKFCHHLLTPLFHKHKSRIFKLLFSIPLAEQMSLVL